MNFTDIYLLLKNDYEIEELEYDSNKAYLIIPKDDSSIRVRAINNTEILFDAIRTYNTRLIDTFSIQEKQQEVLEYTFTKLFNKLNLTLDKNDIEFDYYDYDLENSISGILLCITLLIIIAVVITIILLTISEGFRTSYRFRK